jgi:hypothetical protein
MFLPLALILLIAPMQDSRPEDSVAAALAAPEPATVVEGLKRIQTAASRRPDLIPVLVKIALSGGAEAKSLAGHAISVCGGEAEPVLWSVVRGEAANERILALRFLARVGGESTRTALLPLLDDADPRIAAECCRALAALGNDATDALMLDRHAALVAAGAAAARGGDDRGIEDRGRALELTLHYLTERRHPRGYDALLQALRSPRAATRTTALSLIRQAHLRRFPADARALLPELSGTDRDAVARVLIDAAQPLERELGWRLWRDAGGGGTQHAAVILDLLRSTPAWLGIIVPPPDVASLAFELRVRHALSGEERVRALRSTRDEHVPAAWRALTFEEPLGDLVTRPGDYELSVTKSAAGTELCFAPRGSRRKGFLFGAGSEALGIWYGRDAVTPARTCSRIDAQGRVQGSKMYDAEGRLLAETRYGEWAGSGARTLPLRADYEGAGGRLQSTWQCEHPGIWIPVRATFWRRLPAGSGPQALETIGTLDARQLEIVMAPESRPAQK